MAMRLLLVEDDDAIRVSLKLNLEDEGYDVVEAADGETALDALNALGPDEMFDIVLVDLLLPGVHGLDVIRRVRVDNTTTAVIVVTAQADTHDVVAGLEAGADDYLVKPIAPKELAARIRAVLRRVQTATPAADAPLPGGEGDVILAGELEIRQAAGEVLLGGESLRLTKTEFLLLREMANHPGQVLSKEQLLERVWGTDYLGDSRLVDTHIYRLRSKVERTPATPRHILTVRGLGYKFVM
jgi:two-component system, OmpR family, response regulator MtrA